MTALLQSAEFWMAVSAILPLITLFIPAPYRPLVDLVWKVIQAWPKKKAEPPSAPGPIPKPLENPADIMRDAIARHKERGSQ